jgi:hypothetical protein
MSFPSSIDAPDITMQGGSFVAINDHAQDHRLLGSAVIQLENKVGIGAGSASLNQILVGQGAGTATWGTVWNQANLGSMTATGGTITGQIQNDGTIANGVYGTATWQGGTIANAAYTNFPTSVSAMVLIASGTASNSASIDFTNISNTLYSSYKIIGYNIVPASNGVDLIMRTSVAGTFQAGTADYRHTQLRFISTTVVASGTATDTGINISSIADNLANSGAQKGLNLDLTFYNASQTNTIKVANWDAEYTGSDFLRIIGNGAYLTAGNAIDGFRFLMTSGNITSGVFKLYGFLA